MKTAATIFSGGGGFELGVQGHFKSVWGIEKDEAVAKVFKQNFPETHLVVDNVKNLDPASFKKIDLLHASPPCQQFSTARHSKNIHEEADAGNHVSDFIRCLKPKVFTLENVPGYQRSHYFKKIVDTLNQLGYYWDKRFIDFSDYGVPQSRNRLFLVASQQFFLFPDIKIPHGGWYCAISHLIKDMEETRLAEWQRKKIRNSEFRPLLIPRAGGNIKNVLPRRAYEPAYTIRALEKCRGSHWADVILDSEIKRVSLEATAALMTFPKNYEFSSSKSLNQKILGNAIPPKFVKEISNHLLEPLCCK